MKIEYIDNDYSKGIKYDLNFIVKECKKLKIFPDGVWNPLHLLTKNNGINFLFSERSVGKTTGLLLLGMVFNQFYNVRLHYIRETKAETNGTIVKDLFTTINSCGYVEKITDGRWNRVLYFQNERKWYYVNQDNEGNIEEKANECLMFAMGCDKSDDYKSGYNCPTADFIILDEALKISGYKNYYANFQDILSTLLRFRISGFVFIIGNTVDYSSYWLSEYMIADTVRSMNKGEYREVTLDKGTQVYIEYIADEKISKKKVAVNKRYFGYSNSRLASVTGSGWASKDYPHMPDIDYSILLNNIYIEYNSCLINLELLKTEKIGLLVYAHKATKTYKDSYIYSDIIKNDERYNFRFGKGNKIDCLIWDKLYKGGKFRYATNTDGHIVESYTKACIQGRLL